jgi:hypothetical protein
MKRAVEGKKMLEMGLIIVFKLLVKLGHKTSAVKLPRNHLLPSLFEQLL